jgi:hypothetical protein
MIKPLLKKTQFKIIIIMINNNHKNKVLKTVCHLESKVSEIPQQRIEKIIVAKKIKLIKIL